MTQGIIIYIGSDKVFHETGTYSFDMYPNDYKGHGDEIIAFFKYSRNWTEDLFYDFVKGFHCKYFKDMDYDYEDTMIFGYKPDMSYDIQNNWIDYIYIVNNSGEDLQCKTEKGIEYIPNDSIVIISFHNIEKIINHSVDGIEYEFNDEDCSNAIDALDFYSRMFIGQYNMIDRNLCMLINDYYEFNYLEFTRRHLYTAARSILFKDTDIANWELNGSLGIFSKDTDIRAKNAYDIQQYLRYSAAWCRNPEGGHTVDFRPPLLSGNLGEANCSSEIIDGAVITNAMLKGKQVKIVLQAIKIYIMLLNIDLVGIFNEYTDNKLVIEIIALIEKLCPQSMKDDNRDKKVKQLQKLYEKILYA